MKSSKRKEFAVLSWIVLIIFFVTIVLTFSFLDEYKGDFVSQAAEDKATCMENGYPQMQTVADANYCQRRVDGTDEIVNVKELR